MAPLGLTHWTITPHARFEILRRRIDRHAIERVLRNPEQRHEIRPGRDVFQRRQTADEGMRASLIRAFVDVDRSPAEVVTVYQTSKIAKYWRLEL